MFHFKFKENMCPHHFIGHLGCIDFCITQNEKIKDAAIAAFKAICDEGGETAILYTEHEKNDTFIETYFIVLLVSFDFECDLISDEEEV